MSTEVDNSDLFKSISPSYIFLKYERIESTEKNLRGFASGTVKYFFNK